jgi:hypothetical protein
MFASKEGKGKTHIIQLPRPVSNTPVLTEEEKERKHQARVAQGLKLKEILENKRKEKVKSEPKNWRFMYLHKNCDIRDQCFLCSSRVVAMIISILNTYTFRKMKKQIN